ncbi:unnamed protein product [Meganyctiphanes norvegica]|uniref:Signal transducer and activator of transcription n=2 Tax=Meganyctiphanes norvegica TaxID=48144 RepID=A0AAV2PKL6_MEGNR
MLTTYLNMNGNTSSPALCPNVVQPTRLTLPQRLVNLHVHTQEAQDEVQRLEQEQEAYVLVYYDCTKNNAQLCHLQTQQQTPQLQETLRNLQERKEVAERNIQQKTMGLLHWRMSLIEKFSITLEEIKILQSYVLDIELMNWRREQQLAGNGKPLDYKHLTTIQGWCEQLAEIIWRTRHQMKECERLQTQVPLEAPGVVDMLPALRSHLASLLSSLVKCSFIIEKQPVQVLKTDKNFTCTVRLLVGHKLNVHMTPPKVNVAIITESVASTLLQNESKNINEHCGKILNDTRTMMYNEKTNQMSVNFGNMKLCDIKTMRKHMEKKGAEGVSDQKFALYFQSSFAIGGGELVFTVWTISLPVIVTVHTSQDADAWGTVSWDNAFAEKGRTNFSVSESVPWYKISEMLNMKITAATGRGLTDDNVKFLSVKAFRNLNMLHYNESLLTWSQFCKDNLPDRNFTFWKWFYEIMKIIGDYMKSQWCDSLITGFIGRGQAEELLMNSQSGTFMLRFSDSELGGITIAWMSMADNQKNVNHLKPCLKNDLSIRGLRDRIHDLQDLIFLYPNIPKEIAFGKCYNTQFKDQVNSKGYVDTELKVIIPGMNGAASGRDSMENPSSVESFPNVIVASPSRISPTYDAQGSNPSSNIADINSSHVEAFSNMSSEAPNDGSICTSTNNASHFVDYTSMADMQLISLVSHGSSPNM